MMLKSPLQVARGKYVPKMPKILQGPVKLVEGDKTQSVADKEDIKRLFNNTYGMPILSLLPASKEKSYPAIKVAVVLSGGQAPGGHNVISGLYDGLKRCNLANRLYGFLGGPLGMVDNQIVELTEDMVYHYRNTGGFDIIGSGRIKLEEESQYDKVIENCKKININALVIIGGDDSNTNAAVLAEYFLKKKSGIQVIGVPKTIDGDLKNEVVETPFGFDTACKVYSGLIGNIQRDANSSKKYFHFIRLMGRSASHIALECALQTQPNIAIISEEVEQKNMSLDDVVKYITDIIMRRSIQGNNFGTVIIPEGLVEFIPAMKKLILELNDVLAKVKDKIDLIEGNRERRELVAKELSPESAEVFDSLPYSFANDLIIDRDPHGNVLVSKIETEKLLLDMVTLRIKEKKKAGDFKGKFSAQPHFFGYEGRCASPSNFDADYCYTLGFTASILISEGKTGYIASVKNMIKPAEEWLPGGAPITMMMNMEKRQGIMKPVIRKTLVDLKGKPFIELKEMRETWAMNTMYIYPGPIQYFGPPEVCDYSTQTLVLEKS
ncbi:MAG: diphosphate--fructose-6-phosphate 1-phosphotransferase [Marinilabiliaceae bacterium]|nr:diphosphate--fructose-6-phosphate 1-phosphotransferase [Marinilabiliaceae bacterium]